MDAEMEKTASPARPVAMTSVSAFHRLFTMDRELRDELAPDFFGPVGVTPIIGGSHA